MYSSRILWLLWEHSFPNPVRNPVFSARQQIRCQAAAMQGDAQGALFLPFCGQEFQRRAIVAPALTCGLWAVVEYVTVMAAAAHAMVFSAWPYQLEVALGCE